MADDREYVRYGTPLVPEEDLSRKKGKMAVEQGQARRLAPWQQEVTDSEGRRRFHGAFTGGFSAGYYNSVGSKEGWTPSTFVSSRSQRAGKKEQQVYDFLDDDEKEELKSKELMSTTDYDELGSTAKEVALRAANKDYEKRPSAIPGGVPEEIVIPWTESIGTKLLMKMGWRPGSDASADQNVLPPGVTNKGVGLGLEALEVLDQSDQFEDQSDYGFEEETDNGKGIPSKRSRIEDKGNRDDVLPSFTAATQSSASVQQPRFPPPVIPVDFKPFHTMAAPPDVAQYFSKPEPPEVPSPEPKMTKDIIGVATFVARSGQRFEDILKQKNAANPHFAFLFEGSSGHAFYLRKLWEEQQTLSKQGKQPVHSQPELHKPQLLGADRARILGEKPLATAKTPIHSSTNVKGEAISRLPSDALSEITAQMTSRFTSGNAATAPTQIQEEGLKGVLQLATVTNDFGMKQRREEIPWRPTALLCKRFQLADPFYGKESLPLKPRSGIESLIAVSLLKPAAEPPRPVAPKDATPFLDSRATVETEGPVLTESSIDLYKAIFSDDEEEDDEIKRDRPSTKADKQAGRAKNSDMSNHMAASEFLENLGKELGLRIA